VADATGEASWAGAAVGGAAAAEVAAAEVVAAEEDVAAAEVEAAAVVELAVVAAAAGLVAALAGAVVGVGDAPQAARTAVPSTERGTMVMKRRRLRRTFIGFSPLLLFCVSHGHITTSAPGSFAHWPVPESFMAYSSRANSTRAPGKPPEAPSQMKFADLSESASNIARGDIRRQS
jgi:hypothetical protein